MSWGAALSTFFMSYASAVGSFQLVNWLLLLVGLSDLAAEGLPVRRPAVLISAAVVALADALLVGLLAGTQYAEALGRIYWAGTLYVWLVYAVAMFGEIDSKTCMGLALAQRGLMSLLSMVVAVAFGVDAS